MTFPLKLNGYLGSFCNEILYTNIRIGFTQGSRFWSRKFIVIDVYGFDDQILAKLN